MISRNVINTAKRIGYPYLTEAYAPFNGNKAYWAVREPDLVDNDSKLIVDNPNGPPEVFDGIDVYNEPEFKAFIRAEGVQIDRINETEDESLEHPLIFVGDK